MSTQTHTAPGNVLEHLGVTVGEVPRLRQFISATAACADLLTVGVAAGSLAGWLAGGYLEGRSSPVQASSAPYVFLEPSGGTVATWDCSSPISLKVNFGRLDPDLVSAAIEGLTRATRLIGSESSFKFHLAGSTDWVPSRSGLTTRGRSPGSASVVVFFGALGDTDLLTDPQAIATGGVAAASDNPSRAGAGYVAVNVDSIRRLGIASQPEEMERLFTHELLHVLGLGHVDRRSSILFPAFQPGRGVIGDGERAGLSELARIGC